MALRNLTSDLSDYFKKKPSKQTGRFQQPDRTMSELDVHGKLDTYKRPEINKDVSGKPIINTNFDQPDTNKRYSDNIESNLVKLASVDITREGFQTNIETVHQSPVTVEPTIASGRNETSLTEHNQTDPKGRFDQSVVIIPDTTPDGRFTVSNVDPILSVLKGRFETSDIKPIESVLDGYQVKTDANGNELPSDVEINTTTTFGIIHPAEEGPAIYQLGKAIKYDGTLVAINDSDSHTFAERPIKATNVLPYTSTLDFHSANPNAIPSSYSTSLNTINSSITFAISTTTGTNTFISSDLAWDNKQQDPAGTQPDTSGHPKTQY